MPYDDHITVDYDDKIHTTLIFSLKAQSCVDKLILMWKSVICERKKIFNNLKVLTVSESLLVFPRSYI